MNVLVTGAFQLNSEEIAMLEAAGHKVFTHPDERTPVEQPERYEVVVCNGLFLYNPIERFTNLRLIQLTSAGLDLVPLDYIRAHGIELRACTVSRWRSSPSAAFCSYISRATFLR